MSHYFKIILSIITMLCAITTVSAQNVLIPYRCDNLWGFSDSSKKIIIPCQFQQVLPFSNGLAAVMLQNKWGYVQTNGNLIISNQYDKAFDFSLQKKAVVYKQNKAAIINANGALVLPFEYTASSNYFSEGFVIMRKAISLILLEMNTI